MSAIEESRKQRSALADNLRAARDKDKTAIYAAMAKRISETEQEIRDQMAYYYRSIGNEMLKLAESLEQGGMP
jgi:hypothetical protein